MKLDHVIRLAATISRDTFQDFGCSQVLSPDLHRTQSALWLGAGSCTISRVDRQPYPSNKVGSNSIAFSQWLTTSKLNPCSSLPNRTLSSVPSPHTELSLALSSYNKQCYSSSQLLKSIGITQSAHTEGVPSTSVPVHSLHPPPQSPVTIDSWLGLSALIARGAHRQKCLQCCLSIPE